MRGTDSPHHIHVTELGEPKYVGIALHAASMDDLEKLARAPGASPVEAVDEPGGGKRVRLTDPDGFQVEVIHGMANCRRSRSSGRRSTAARTRRSAATRSITRRSSAARRTSSASAISSSIRRNIEKTVGWYREMFGFRPSDEVYVGSKDNITGSFNRLDRGDDFVDHHAFFCIRSDKAGLNHLSYEAADIDDIMIGHDVLVAKGYEHFWGIGRHSLGSQVYDYWGDPWGRVHEHWADTDVLNASVPPNLISREELAGPWGGPPPEKFMHHAVA